MSFPASIQPPAAITKAQNSNIASKITKSYAALPLLQIFEKFAGATCSKPCHLHVHELSEPEVELKASRFVMTATKMVVKRATMKETIAKRVEARFRVRALLC